MALYSDCDGTFSQSQVISESMCSIGCSMLRQVMLLKADWLLKQVMCLTVKERFVFFHIKPCERNVYDHKRCSEALLWGTVNSLEMELVADINARWKQLKKRKKNTEEHVHSGKMPKNTISTCLFCLFVCCLLFALTKEQYTKGKKHIRQKEKEKMCRRGHKNPKGLQATPPPNILL